MLPTSLSTFLLLMSALQDRLRRMLDTTWGSAGQAVWARARLPGCLAGPTRKPHGGRWQSPGDAPHPPAAPQPPGYLVQLLTLGRQLRHNGLHAAPAGAQCGLWGDTGVTPWRGHLPR